MSFSRFTRKPAAPLVPDVNNIRLGMAGMVSENDHPYSWSAILNGYDPKALGDCPNEVIRHYLSAQPKSDFGISGVRVTHIWCDDPDNAVRVARTSRIPRVVRHAEELIGEVDAVLIPTDIGGEHRDRARPFVENNVPVFIDKPLTDRYEDLRSFMHWYASGKKIMSSSCMRYAREFAELRRRRDEVGKVRLITVTMCKSWERYGIHAMEAVYPFLQPFRWSSVTNSGTEESNIVHVHHASGVEVIAATIEDLYGAMGCVSLYGMAGSLTARFADSFYAFRAQLAAFVQYLRSGVPPFRFDETVELIQMVIAGTQSRQNQGKRTVLLNGFRSVGD